MKRLLFSFVFLMISIFVTGSFGRSHAKNAALEEEALAYTCYSGYCCWGPHLKIECSPCNFKYMWSPEVMGTCSPTPVDD